MPVVGAGHGNTGYDGGGDSWELHGGTRLYRVRTKPLLQYFNQLAVCIRAFLGMRDQIPKNSQKFNGESLDPT